MVWARIIACIVYTEFVTEWGGESEFTVEVQTAQDATSTQSMCPTDGAGVGKFAFAARW